MYNRRRILFNAGLPQYAGVCVGGFCYLAYGLDLAIPIVEDGIPSWADKGLVSVPTGVSDIKSRDPLAMSVPELEQCAYEHFPSKVWKMERVVYLRPFVGAILCGCRDLMVFDRIKAIGVYL